jgi:hypothetical protein
MLKMDYVLCINRFVISMEYGLCLILKTIYYIKMDYGFNLISFFISNYIWTMDCG